MAEYSAEILRIASAIIAGHGSAAAGVAEKIAANFRKPGGEDDARQWKLICSAIRAIETAVPLPNLMEMPRLTTPR
jgi:hypothetical protein